MALLSLADGTFVAKPKAVERFALAVGDLGRYTAPRGFDK
jgi:hypothetical protein